MKREEGTPRREDLARLLPAPEVLALTEDGAREIEELVMKELHNMNAAARTSGGDAAVPAAARPRWRRPAWVAVPAALALTAGAVAYAVAARDGGASDPAGPVAAPATAGQLLDRVASVAGREDVPVPDADQFIYSRVLRTVEWPEPGAYIDPTAVGGEDAVPGEGEVGPSASGGQAYVEVIESDQLVPVPAERESERWISPDGTRGWTHDLEDGVPGEGRSLDTEPWEPYLEAPTYDFLATLPTDADGLLDRVYGEFGESDGLTGEALEQRVFEGLGDLAFADLLPPGLEDGVYEALGRVPGIELLEDAEDAAGRPALGVARTGAETGVRSAYLFAPDTYEYLGYQEVQVEERDGVEAGTVWDEYALLGLGVVDEVRQRPGEDTAAV
ncbi:CU044_5270 family protein [Streptomyces marincola]|uniref:CU044_5270 family protein n=1 Tax=Streptomyces marincola TaxID=2878388 RepID=UPI001CF34B5A|nr:CU044_5270 family protein [Streptomyces marincola]UCM91171.1 CU044_5270 family protein [Streptomyces marincola]